MPVRVTDYISTSASADTYATHISTLGKGGQHEVVTINERNLITVERQNLGMKVYVLEDKTTYELTDTGWAKFIASKGSYTHDQQSPMNTWTITHNLGFYPNIIVIDPDGEQVMGNTYFDSINIVRLVFSIPLYGKAYLS